MNTTTPSRKPHHWDADSIDSAVILLGVRAELTGQGLSAVVSSDDEHHVHPAPAPQQTQRQDNGDVIQALRRELSLVFGDTTCRLRFGDDGLHIDGEVRTIALKRRAVRVAGAHPDVGRVVDRLHVTPGCTISDARIAEHLADALREEAALAECLIRKHCRGAEEIVQRPDRAHGEIRVSVESGVITLAGRLPTRVQKRLSGVLAWWSPGAREVINQLDVLSTEPDDDDAIALAVRMALEMDPLVDASQIRVVSRADTVTLTGLVWNCAERQCAENDAWSVFGVGDIDNRLLVAESSLNR